jgi:hypothetical protein
VDGYDGLKQAVREKFRRDNNLHFQDDQVLVTCGAKQALYDLCQTLLRPGDEAVVPRPYWVTYPAQVTLAEAQTVYLDLDAEDGYLPRAERLNAALTDATRLVFLNSPNNPTGRIYDRDTLEALAEVLRRYPRVFIVSDDIYEHLNWTGEPFRNLLNVAPDLADRCFIVNGVSKAYAMTGWRVARAPPAPPASANTPQPKRCSAIRRRCGAWWRLTNAATTTSSRHWTSYPACIARARTALFTPSRMCARQSRACTASTTTSNWRRRCCTRPAWPWCQAAASAPPEGYGCRSPPT